MNLLFKGWFLGSMLICLGVTCQSRYGYEIGWNGWRGPGWTGNWKTCCVRDRPSLLGKLLLRFREIQRWELYRYHYPLWENYYMISHNTSWYMDVITSKKQCPMNEKQWKTVEGCSSGISKTCTKKTCCCKKVSPSGTWKRSQMTSLAIKRMLVHRLSSVHCKDVFVFFGADFTTQMSTFHRFNQKNGTPPPTSAHRYHVGLPGNWWHVGSLGQRGGLAWLNGFVFPLKTKMTTENQWKSPSWNAKCSFF